MSGSPVVNRSAPDMVVPTMASTVVTTGAAWLPQPFRALGVGTLGLTTDVCVFTILMGYAPQALLMRILSLAAAGTAGEIGPNLDYAFLQSRTQHLVDGINEAVVTELNLLLGNRRIFQNAAEAEAQAATSA